METKKRVLLNRAVFTQRPYDSSALTVLTTLFHRFAEPGDYDVIVRPAGLTPGARSVLREQRFTVKVVAIGAPSQLNIDLAALDTSSGGERGCCPGEGSEYVLQANGVVGFYAAQGAGAYSLVIKRSDAREKKILLDSASQIPAGDLFAVTLVRPGTYKVVDQLGGRHEAVVHAVMPPAPKPEALRRGAVRPSVVPATGIAATRPMSHYRPDQPSLVTFDQNGFSNKEVKLFAGQAVVFLCQAPARLRVELADPADVTPAAKRLTVKRNVKRDT